MRGFLKRLRGFIGTALTWAFGWAGVTFVVGGLGGIGPGILLWAARVALVGFIAGGSFAAILSIAERRKSLEELSLSRIAVWGGVGSLLIIGLISVLAGVPFWREAIIATLLGMGSATGSVVLARRADEPRLPTGEDHPPRLPDAD